MDRVVHCVILDSMELEIVNLYTEISPIHVDIPDKNYAAMHTSTNFIFSTSFSVKAGNCLGVRVNFCNIAHLPKIELTICAEK